VIAFVLAILTEADARLWETKAQIDARYGKPIRVDKDPNGDLYTYRFKQCYVLVTFLDGKSQSELYLRTDYASRLTSREIQEIFSMNTVGNSSWRTSDGIFALVPKAGGHPIAVAAYSANDKPPILGLSTADFVKKSGWVSGNRKKR
jgi:hypothetical protein